MAMLEYLEKDREKILSDLVGASQPERAVKVLESELDRLLYQYNESAAGQEGAEGAAEKAYGDRLRSAAAAMVETAKISLAYLTAMGDPKIWERTETENPDAPDKKPVPVIAWILLLAGAAMPFAALVLAAQVPDGTFRFVGSPVTFALAGGGAVLLLIAGFLLRRVPLTKKQTKITQAELLVDSEKAWRALRAVVMSMDRRLEETEAELKWEQREKLKSETKGTALLPAPEIDFFGDLLEAAYSGDGEFALERLGGVRFFLHKNGVEAVEWSPEKDELFDRLPGSENGTIRPALVTEETVLKKGLAAVKTV